jgi:protein O-mannosyl-transferase
MTANREKNVVTLCLLLVASALAFYNPIVHNQFIDFDDASYILKNAQVHDGLTWSTVKWSFSTFQEGNWHPLTWMSHALDYQLFRFNPVGHHYTNLLLHAANVVLLFLLLQRATGFTWRSFFVAGFFALHPINVESVAWAAERKNVLSMLFLLLAMHAYDRYARSGKRFFYFVVAICFSLGLMAKPQIVTLPFVLLLWDYWPLQRIGFGSPDTDSVSVSVSVKQRSFGYLVWEKLPLFLIAAADSVVTVIAQRSGNTVRTFEEVSLLARIENVFVSYVRYVGKALWPTHLAPMYPRTGTSLPIWQVVGSIAILLLITAIVIRWRDRRYLPVGWFWFLGTAVPMIGIITVGEQAMADRYAYLPLIGLFIAIVWSVDTFASEQRIPSAWRAIPAAVVLLVLGCLTYRQISYWHDDETLWRYTLSVTDQNYMAHNNLALALAKQGKSDEAVVQFRAAETLHNYPPQQVLLLAFYELNAGHFPEAIEDSQSVLKNSPDPKLQSVAWSIRGRANLELHHDDEANQNFQNALRLDPKNDMAVAGVNALAQKRAF